jgi:hypothetical protein
MGMQLGSKSLDTCLQAGAWGAGSVSQSSPHVRTGVPMVSLSLRQIDFWQGEALVQTLNVQNLESDVHSSRRTCPAPRDTSWSLSWF